MKRQSLFVAAFLFLGGLLRLTAPSAPPAPRPSHSLGKEVNKSGAHGTVTTGPKTAFEHALADEIASYYGCRTPADSSLKEKSELYWNVPEDARDNVQFLIGLVPDPVHTHLGMLFDRTIQALEQAVQQQGDYSLDRSILPWRHAIEKSSGSVADREKEESDRVERESFPGLLIFRGSRDDSSQPSQGASAAQNTKQNDGCTTQRPLFVFLVAETPTGGIRVNQFQNSLVIMRAIRSGGVKKEPGKNPPLYVFGPTFSGTLESLQRQLNVIPKDERPAEFFVYSGNVTSAPSIDDFKKRFSEEELHFASFQENDEFSILQFARFAYCKGYDTREIAVLSEDDTTYGQALKKYERSKAGEQEREWNQARCPDGKPHQEFDGHFSDLLHLHFPREISFFRSAYEKELAAKQEAAAKVPGKAVLPLNLEDEGTDDDAIAPYAGPQTSLSQEAVMLGVVSELQKHHIKFTIVLATNPLDQLFLARYLRDSYPQGRVVVTVPDLLLVSQEDSLLQGVLGLNVYSLVPGQSDLLQESAESEACPKETETKDKQPEAKPNQEKQGEKKVHEDRLFESSTNVGDYNAMVGLLSAMRFERRKGATGFACKSWNKEKLPPAPYEEYGPPCLPHDQSDSSCPNQPLTWLTILGHDGYWPISSLSDFKDDKFQVPDPRLPVSNSRSQNPAGSTLVAVDQPFAKSASLDEDSREAHTTPAWNIAYCICLIGLVLHVFLSWTGTFLSNSEMQAQFANTHDKPGVVVMAMGAFWLVAAFLFVLCARSPLLYGGLHSLPPIWHGGYWLTIPLWIPLIAFMGMVHWDLVVHRRMPRIGWGFTAFAVLLIAFQLTLAYDGFRSWLPILWSTRYLHFASAVSPIAPFLFLCAAGYWWVWLSLRSLSIVDLRRPRLPAEAALPAKSARISDSEGEKVREAAHPTRFAMFILVILLGVFLISLTVLDLRHPLQSLEGYVYDWGYSGVLAFAIAVYLGCLIRLTRTWFSYKHVLTGLDRLPLREAFSRMKRLSWKSMWNPGGSTLRETYRVMSRTFENLEKLEAVLKDQPPPPSSSAPPAVGVSIQETKTALDEAMKAYLEIVSSSPIPAQAQNQSTKDASTGTRPSAENAPQSERELLPAVARFTVTGGAAAATAMAKEIETVAPQEKHGEDLDANSKEATKSKLYQTLAENIGKLQIIMANLARFLVNAVKTYLEIVGPQEKTEQGSNANPKKPTKSGQFTKLVKNIETLQIKMADTAGFLIRDVLTPMWQNELEPVVSSDRRVKKADLSLVRVLGEEYAALIYVNFLQSILLQMRTLVMCAAGMYVLIVCSMNFYPFEPHPALQVLSVVLLVVAGAVVGFVYAEMHRDAILSRLTSTNAGELGWDFWLKFVSAGALPVFSLLAVQFPEIGRFLFSWLGPFLQSAK